MGFRDQIQPKLGWAGQSPVTFPQSGLTITPGAGLYPTTDTATPTLKLDAERNSPTETFPLFVPGVLPSSGTLGKWSNFRASQLAPLAGFQLDAITAPTTTDAANYVGVQLTDGAGSKAVLPILGATRHVALGAGYGAVIAQPWLGTGTPSLFTYSNGTAAQYMGLISTFQPTSALSVTGVNFWVFANAYGGAYVAGVPIRCQLLDSSFDVIAQAYATTAGSLENLAFAFPLAVSLAAGSTYYVAFDVFENPPDGSTWYGLSTAAYSGGSAQSAPLTAVGDTGGVNGGAAAGKPPTSATWADIVPSSGSLHNHFGGAWAWGPLTPDAGGALLGESGLVNFSGDVTLSAYTVGAPPATGFPTDTNIRAIFAGAP